MSEFSRQLKAAMELERELLDEQFEDVVREEEALGALELAKNLILIDRCTMRMVVMSVEGMGEQLEQARVVAVAISTTASTSK